MRDWNAIVTVRGRSWPEARKAACRVGRVARTGFYNVLVMKVDEPMDLLARLEALAKENPTAAGAIAYVSPAEQCFDFATADEFRTKSRETVLALAPRLAGRTFHVRMRRRGCKGALASPEEERALADVIIEATGKAGAPAQVNFEDPDAIVRIETVDGRAGIALWSRADRYDHPLLSTH